MTIALGFNCPDGIVLCADSMDTDGYTKTKVDKIWCYETQDEWGIAVASAGESDFFCGVGRYVAPGIRFWLGMHANGPRRHINGAKG
jgi:hypothetical protein